MKRIFCFPLVVIIFLSGSILTASATSNTQTIHRFISSDDRDGFREWADQTSVSEINRQVGSLRDDERKSLCAVLLDSSEQGSGRKALLKTMDAILSRQGLGFYAHIFSYTSINLEGDGFYYWGNGQVTLNRDAFLSQTAENNKALLMHECFHSFNDRNSGPVGALNEGAGIWIYKKAFGKESSEGDFAEATYGTKLYYKVFMDSPDYPLEAPRSFSDKLVEVYTWLSDGDPSHLPWWDDALLKEMFNRYYATLNRDTDFYSIWLPSVEKARQAMLADPMMLSLDRIPMPRAYSGNP